MKLFFIFLSCLFIQSSFAADISFVIYHSKGSVKKTGTLLNLKKGDKLRTTDILQLGEGSSVMLVCSNYKVIQVSKRGLYPVKGLLALCDKVQKAYSSTYFKYIWEQFTHPHGEPEKDPEEYMKNVGAVSRGCNEVATGIPTDTILYHSGSLPINWWSVYQNSSAAIYEQPLDGAPVKKIPLVKDKPLPLNNLLNQLAPGEYYWQIIGEDGSGCERKYVKIIDKASYTKRVLEIVNAIPVSSPAATAFARAYLLEENHFITEAMEYYRQAVTLDAANEIYKKSFNKFYETKF